MRWRLFLRRTVGVVVGLVFAGVLVNSFWTAALLWFPPALPDDAGEATWRAFVMTMPVGGHVAIVAGWFVTGSVGAYAALRVAQWRPAGWIVAAAIAGLAGFYLTRMVQPVWIEILSVALPLAGAWLAERHFRHARRGDPLIN